MQGGNADKRKGDKALPEQEEIMLAELRERKGMSQSQLSKASGISVRTIQAYEQGARKLSGASYDNLKKLSDALGVTIEELVK